MVSPARDSSPQFQLHCLFVVEPEVCAPEGSSFPCRAGASGSHHLPWALPRVLQVIPKIKRLGGSDCPFGRGCGAVCCRGARSASLPGRRASVIAAKSAGKRRGKGRDGRRRKDTGRPGAASSNGTVKVGATGGGRKAGSPQSQRQLTRPRGQSQIGRAHV